MFCGKWGLDSNDLCAHLRVERNWGRLLVGCLTSLQQASVSQGSGGDAWCSARHVGFPSKRLPSMLKSGLVLVGVQRLPSMLKSGLVLVGVQRLPSMLTSGLESWSSTPSINANKWVRVLVGVQRLPSMLTSGLESWLEFNAFHQC